MKILEKYRAENKALTISEFKDLSIEEMCLYDFMRQGGIPDECLLNRKVYALVYPGYKRNRYRGDTVNTMRYHIERNKGEFFVAMKPEEQDEILEIIKKTITSSSTMIWHYNKGNKIQVCNNYRLGNFCIFPRGKINSARSIEGGYNDYFDLLLAEVKKFYDGEISNETRLQKEIQMCSKYFESFGDFNNYIEVNFFQDFFDENGEIIKLSKIVGLEDYLKATDEIILKRGRRIAQRIKENS